MSKFRGLHKKRFSEYLYIVLVVLRGYNISVDICAFLTSRVTELDKIIGLRAGGDDYITKPFSLDELTARVEAHIGGRTTTAWQQCKDVWRPVH